MAASSSSSSGGTNISVWLYDATFVRVAFVVVPMIATPWSANLQTPPLVTYLGNSYVWSDVKFAYIVQTPTAATLSNPAAPAASVLANPVF